MKRKIQIAAPDDARIAAKRTQMFHRIQSVDTRQGDHRIGRRRFPCGFKKLFLIAECFNYGKPSTFGAELRDLLCKKTSCASLFVSTTIRYTPLLLSAIVEIFCLLVYGCAHAFQADWHESPVSGTKSRFAGVPGLDRCDIIILVCWSFLRSGGVGQHEDCNCG